MSVPAPRGLIFDREGRPIAVSVPSWTVKVRPADLPPAARGRVLARVAQLVGSRTAARWTRLDAFRGSPFDLVPVARGVGREAALLIGEEADDLPGVVIEVEAIRQYLDETGAPGGQLLSHVIGYTGPGHREELDSIGRRDTCATTSSAGPASRPRSRTELRGTYGDELRGAGCVRPPLKVIETIREPEPGTNLMLTIDADMQRLATRGAEVGHGRRPTCSQGVTIVMNPQTGEILAMVSLPAYDNNKFAGRHQRRRLRRLPERSRPSRCATTPSADIYPPGSTFKLVTGHGGDRGGRDHRQPRMADLRLLPDPRRTGRAVPVRLESRGLRPAEMVDAFAKSSDTFFYQMAVEPGVDPLGGWAQRARLRRATGHSAARRGAGHHRQHRVGEAQGRSGVFTGELAQAGIGQNVIAVTPLQLLNAYAAVANGGDLMRPMIVRGETDAAGEPDPRIRAGGDPRPRRRSAPRCETMRIGAREVITSGHAYNIRDLDLPGALSGKTGTAEFGELTAGRDLPFHSWFVAYLPIAAGATDAELGVVTFTYSAVVPGNVSLEVVKYFLQEYFNLDQDLRLDPNEFSLVTAN